MSGALARTVVPATSANLGPAFDCAAVALQLHLSVEVEARDGPGCLVEYRGPQPEAVATDESNLICRAIASSRSGRAPEGLRLLVASEIPIGVGLGSSAAAIVAGLLVGQQLDGGAPDIERVLALASAMEGHPDNVAAALLGGLVVSGQIGSRVVSRRAPLPTDLLFVVVTPRQPMPTELARAALPELYSRADVVQNLQRVALLTACAFSGDFDLWPELFEDRLHQPQRASLMPGLASCLQLDHPDLLGVFLSGAGSSVTAIARRSGPEIAHLLSERFDSAGVQSESRVLAAENRGGLASLPKVREWA